MRTLGKQISQKGSGKKIKKSANQLLTEIQQKKKIKKSALAKQLGVSDRTLRSYKKYFASLDNPEIKLTKNDRKPPKKILDKISKLATNKKIPKTRIKGTKYDRSEVDKRIDVISKSTFNQIKKEAVKDDFFGLLIRVHVLFIGKEGTFDEWVTFVPPKRFIDDILKSPTTLNNYITGELEKIVNNKRNLYQLSTILGFEILEVAINVTTTKVDSKSNLNIKDKK